MTGILYIVPCIIVMWYTYILLGGRAAKLLGPCCFCYVFFSLKYCKSPTAAYIVNWKLLKFSAMVTNNPLYPLTQSCGTVPKGGATVKNHELGLFLLTRLTWTQNSFTIIISRIRRIYKISKPKMWLFHNFILKPNMIKRFTGYKNNQKFTQIAKWNL